MLNAKKSVERTGTASPATHNISQYGDFVRRDVDSPLRSVQKNTPPTPVQKKTAQSYASNHAVFQTPKDFRANAPRRPASATVRAESTQALSAASRTPAQAVRGNDNSSESVNLDAFIDENFSSFETERQRIKKEKAEAARRLKEEKKAAKLAWKEEKQKTRVRIPIGRKLIAIISLIIVVALGGVTYLVSYFVSQDVKISAEENNLIINSRLTSDCDSRIANISSSIGMLLDMLRNAGEDEVEFKKAQAIFFDHNKDIVAVYLKHSDLIFLNTTFLISHGMDTTLPESYFQQESETITRTENGSFGLKNASPFFSLPMLAIFEPLTNGSDTRAIGILYSAEKLSESFSAGSVNQSVLVNSDGELLVHADLSLMLNASDPEVSYIFGEMQKSAQNNGQMTYSNEDDEEYIGAFRKLGIGNGGVITTVKTSVIYEGVQATTRRNIYITAAILFLTIMIVWFFSQSLSVPLRKLTAVVNEINTGNFNTDLFGLLSENGKDEIGVLTRSTKNEREILNTFTTLTNKGVTEAIIKKQIDFEPHLKDITIFFSDIRGFTAISDGFKNRFGAQSAAEIINFLNDYMSRMVMCIQLTGGTVDKFEGDAIMACWGVLRNETLDWEDMSEFSVTRSLKKEEHDKYVQEDAMNAITCCIAMRYALMKYNKDAEAFTKIHEGEPLAQYKPHIKIGAGLNSGRATVGFLGSKQKMEFTSIGDAVNFASRAESSNKPCGTDILITEDTYALLAPKYIRCEQNNFTLLPENEANEIIVEQIPVTFDVKGKGKQHFYGVVNMPRFDIERFFKQGDENFEIDLDCVKAAGPAGPKNLHDVRRILDIPEPDFGMVNLNAEENKVQVSAS